MTAKTYAVMNGAAPGAAAAVADHYGHGDQDAHSARHEHDDTGDPVRRVVGRVRWLHGCNADQGRADPPHRWRADDADGLRGGGHREGQRPERTDHRRSSWVRRSRASPTRRLRSPRRVPSRWRRTSCRRPPGSTSSSRSVVSRRCRCPRSAGFAPRLVQRSTATPGSCGRSKFLA